MGLFSRRKGQRLTTSGNSALQAYEWATSELEQAWKAFHAASDQLAQDEATYRIKAAECRLEAARQELRDLRQRGANGPG